MTKEIQLLGDYLGDIGAAGSGWVMTTTGPRYRVGPRDSLTTLAKRYLGDFRGEGHIMSLQTREVQQRGVRAGDVLVMPTVAIERAHSLGLLPEPGLTYQTGVGQLEGFGDLADAWTNGHRLQEKIDVDMSVVSATVQQDQAGPRKLDGETVAAWGKFFQGWTAFKGGEPSPVWAVLETAGYLNTLSSRWDEMKRTWEPGVFGWASKLKSVDVPLVGPLSTPPDAPGGDAGEGSSTVKWVAVAAIAVAAAYALGPILRGAGRK